MTYEQAVRILPAKLIVALGEFCDDPEKRQGVVHKGESHYKVEYTVQELIKA